MHIRTISRRTPAKAVNIEEFLFVANGVIGLFNSVVSAINSAANLIETLGKAQA